MHKNVSLNLLSNVTETQADYDLLRTASGFYTELTRRSRRNKNVLYISGKCSSIKCGLVLSVLLSGSV